MSQSLDFSSNFAACYFSFFFLLLLVALFLLLFLPELFFSVLLDFVALLLVVFFVDFLDFVVEPLSLLFDLPLFATPFVFLLAERSFPPLTDFDFVEVTAFWVSVLLDFAEVAAFGVLVLPDFDLAVVADLFLPGLVRQ
ncbi:MAG: hypothetical protein GY792_25970 [Gammaproteobacteria bacterium]|nr:hypothetical protein [Gammaproteobacteria bacterium]